LQVIPPFIALPNAPPPIWWGKTDAREAPMFPSVTSLRAAGALVLALCAPMPLAARPMTSEDTARIEVVSDIAVSPDGSRIAYTTLRFPDVTRGQRNGGARAQLGISVGPDLQRDFLAADMDVSEIAFSPNGRTIGFIWSERDGKDAVWGLPVDGGGHRKLGEVSGAHIEAFAFSPDGSMLYMLAEAETDRKLHAQKQAGFDARVFEEEPQFNRLFVARLGVDVDPRPRQIAVPGHVSEFTIMPDGRHALIKTAPSPSVDDSYTSNRVAILDLVDGTVRTLQTPGKLGDLEVSPDGRTLSLIAAVDEHDPAPTTLYLVDVATLQMRALNADRAEAAMDAAWIDSQHLAVVIHKGASSHYRVYARDGGIDTEMTTGSLVVTNVEAAGGKIAFRADSPANPPELYVLRGTEFQRWTRHNAWLSGVDLGKQRVLTYRARDGQVIEGILIEPVGGIPKGGAPTILDVHGGPETHESNGWNSWYSAPGQVAAGKGYAVFLPNYRGSTGYGTAFSKQHQRDPAGKEFDDLVDAKLALVPQGIADPAKFGITGGSYGGYATAWASTALSEHFAAGVMLAGISNEISKYGTTEIPDEMYLVHERMNPWDDWMFMLQRSPVYHTDKARTPLLIVHGEEDSRVHPGQALELYRFLKARGNAPVRLVLYPGEGHGNRKAAARLDYNLRMMEWFDRFLKGEGSEKALPPVRPAMLPENPQQTP
jgi:dipeptidyl aminopeptidase/acylaminoacyl peptidase